MLEEITSDVQGIVESKKRKRDDAHIVNKFVSVAEQTKLFETQLRYPLRSKSPISKFCLTIPESPVLLTETRVRSVKFPSTEEGEQKEMSKLKVMPVNSKIHEPLQLGKNVHRSLLDGKPFELTEYKRKVVHDSSSPFRFVANTLTTEALQNHCDTSDKSFISLTAKEPHSPSCVTHLQNKIQTSKDTGDNVIGLGKSPNTNINVNKTQPNPFSFERRDKLMMTKKNEKMKKILQEEKKARIFHAKSVPVWVKLHAKYSCNEKKSLSSTTLSNDDEKKTMLKAYAATELQKKTIVPKLPTVPENIILHTELRAQSWKEFDKHLKKKDREIEIELQKRKEIAEKKQEEEVALLRRQTVHKPQPIGKCKSQSEGSKHATIS